MLKTSFLCLSAAGLLGAVLPLASTSRAQEVAEPAAVPPLRVERVGEKDAYAFAEVPISEYWIGIALAELPDVVKKQLGIEHGLVVGDAMPDSPAAKAGFEKHDILLKVGDKVLKEPADLVNAVDEAQETEMSIALLRGGKELTLKVTPIKRADVQETRVIRLDAAAPAELRVEIQRLEEALRSLKDKAGGEGLGIFFARPGMVAPHDFRKPAEFPKDLSIQVTKDGEEKAKIHVKKGDQEWEVTEDKLSELPDDVRPHVHHFFGRLWSPKGASIATRPVQPGVVYPPSQFVPGAAVPPPATAPRNPRAFSYRVETRGVDDKLDEIMKELKSLRKDLDELRDKSPEEKK